MCFKYNAGTCTSKVCPNGRRHVCRYCGGKHMGIKCTSKPGGSKTPKGKGKGKGKGKSKAAKGWDSSAAGGAAE